MTAQRREPIPAAGTERSVITGHATGRDTERSDDASRPAVRTEPAPGEPGSGVIDVMSTPVVAVPISTPLHAVLQVMLRLGRRHVIVVDGQGRCAGILADRVVAAAWAADPSALSRVPAWQVLPVKPSLVDGHATIRDVAALMIGDEVDAVAVVDALDHPIGIVTGSDVIRFMARSCLPELPQPPDDPSVRVLRP